MEIYEKLLSSIVASSTNKKPESKKNVFDTRFNFPNVGESDVLYIATDENAIYRWDEINQIYRDISSGSGSCVEFNVIQSIL